MRVLLLIVLATLPSRAQFRSVKLWFSGVGCDSCTESMPERLRRLRGVESAKVDAAEGTLDVQLAEQNRVRFEQIRDLIEQDGTKVTRAFVRVMGDVSKVGDRWMLKPAASSSYEVSEKGVKVAPGLRT